ncbi:hypothetical protein ASY01nite_20420 [Acetobacter syzygii]|nr:hypothetical protein Absy_012_002 [Acetobacter syzygii]GBR64457.1 hypothetical protein AA0483_1372 [Acetobacter syzygii NRIC 0483]GEL56976.1 hypothetical protein ASY01nite_20420 [Acetobacter syzygii]
MNATGKNGKARPVIKSWLAGCRSVAIRAVAPPGGCSERVRDITIIARQTDNPHANGSGIPVNRETLTPIMAESILPRMIALGVAKGLAGTANARTAEAPMGATIAM